MTPDLEIIIVNFNTRQDLEVCLASLLTTRPDALAQITVVDNHSSDGSVEAVRARWPEIEVIALDRNVGFAAANNVALRRPGAPFALLLNSDTVVPPGAIDGLRQRLLDTDAVAAGPRLVDGSGRPEISFGPMLTPWAEMTQRLRVRSAGRPGRLARQYVRRYVSRERFVDWISGACLLVRRDEALAAGLLDERYFMYEEDVDFCAALRARGGRVLFSPAVQIVHLRGRSIGKSGAGSTHYDRSHLAFYRKHAPRWAPWLERWLAWRGRAIR